MLENIVTHAPHYVKVACGHDNLKGNATNCKNSSSAPGQLCLYDKISSVLFCKMSSVIISFGQMIMRLELRFGKGTFFVANSICKAWTLCMCELEFDLLYTIGLSVYVVSCKTMWAGHPGCMTL